MSKQPSNDMRHILNQHLTLETAPDILHKLAPLVEQWVNITVVKGGVLEAPQSFLIRGIGMSHETALLFVKDTNEKMKFSWPIAAQRNRDYVVRFDIYQSQHFTNFCFAYWHNKVWLEVMFTIGIKP